MSLTPVTPKADRIIALDVLRGFALFGVLMVNMMDFSSSALLPGYVAPEWGTLNLLIEAGFYVFFVTKFYLLFSFLFGVGFAVQMGRMEANGRAFVPFYLRRLGILAVIGFLHWSLVWRGDILMTYAAMGLVLLLVRRLSARSLIALGGVAVLVSFGVSGVTVGQENAEQGLRAAQIYREGSYLEVLTHRLTDFSDSVFILGQLPSVLVMFLLGLGIGRSGVLEKPEVYHPFLRRWMWPALGIGLAFNLMLVAMSEGGNIWVLVLLLHIGAPALSFFYASVVLLNVSRLRRLAPLGQMALTNYLTHSLIGTTLFYGYGFGWYDQITPLGHVGLVVVIYGVQIVFSQWWMVRFRFGPLEWLWRSLTYGQRQPMRRQSSTEIRTNPAQHQGNVSS